MKRVALVVPGLEAGGGVPVVALFLAQVMVDSGRYQPELVSVAMSVSDPDSVRLLSPALIAEVQDLAWTALPVSVRNRLQRSTH